MSYVDLLDSAKSAHPNEFVTEWWRKSSLEIQANAKSLAKTELMIRILHGETILVSNNQAFDSVAFLEALSELTKMSFLERPPLALSYFKLPKQGEIIPDRWNPNVLIDLSKEYLEKKTFVFSAWVAMDDNTGIRTLMSDALVNDTEESSRFLSMVERVYVDLDSSIRDNFRKQARNLQVFYDYLRFLYAQGKNVVRKAGRSPSEREIWTNLDELRYSPSKGIPVEALKTLEDELIGQNLYSSREDRSVLYRLIKDFASPLREELRNYIDFYYNQKIGSSVSPKGRGTYTMTEHSSEISVAREENLVENAESVNSKDGIVGEIALEIIPEAAPNLDTLTWDDVVKVLSEEKTLRDSAYDLQDNLALYNQLDPQRPDYSVKLNELRKMVDESLEKHQMLLASKLAPKIMYDSAPRRFFSYVSPVIGSVGGAALGSYVGYLFQNPIAGNLASATTSEALSKILSAVLAKTSKEDLESSAAGSIRETLNKSAKVTIKKE